MSDHPECSRCNNQVQSNWKYCRFCGNKLEQVQKVIQTSQEDAEELTEPKHEEFALESDYEFDKKLYYKVLSSRAERSVILRKKEKIRKEIDALLDQLQSGLIGEETVLPKVKELRKEVKQINEQNKAFSNIPDELPIEVLNDQIEAAEQRIRKIKMLDADENLSKDTIREARKRTENSLAMLRDQQSKLFGHIRSWKNDLKADIDEIRKDIEHLYVRYKTDEITEEAYREKKSKLTTNIQTDEEVVEILEKILQ